MPELNRPTNPGGDAAAALLPVRIVDVTNRDGVQGAGVHVSSFSRLFLLSMLARVGIWEAEIGFPCLEHEWSYLRAATALKRTGALGTISLSGWCRGTETDVSLATAACPELDGLNLSIPVSDRFIHAKFRGERRWSDILARALRAVGRGKELGMATVTVNMEDASRASLDRVKECGRLARDAGADRVRYCDTVGVENPLRLYRRIGTLAARGIGPLVIHCHNDTGMAVACSLSAREAVLAQGGEPLIDTTVNGLGERAGNTSLLTVLLALRTGFPMEVAENAPPWESRRDFIDTSYHRALGAAAKAAGYLAVETGVPLPSREPGIGEQVYCHSSGIHIDGMLKDSGTYEPFPAIAGAPCRLRTPPGTSLVLGPYSGMHALRHVYGTLGCDLDGEEARRLLPLVHRVILQLKRPAEPEELRFMRDYPEIVATLVGYRFPADPGSADRALLAGTAM